MQTFVLMTKLSQEMSAKMKNREQLGRQWLDEVKHKCPKVKFIAHYALLGTYDFMDIYEAPDSRENGAMQAESWTAIPYKQFLKLINEC
jgi:uncharacterized protein with GYD domain